MAVTAVFSQQNANRGTATGAVALTGTYVNPGGSAITAAQLGMNSLFGLDINPDSGFVFEYIPTNTTTGKLKIYWTGAGLGAALAEVTNGQSMAAVTAARYEAIGA